MGMSTIATVNIPIHRKPFETTVLTFGFFVWFFCLVFHFRPKVCKMIFQILIAQSLTVCLLGSRAFEDY